MSETIGLIIGGTAGITLGGVGAYLGARFMSGHVLAPPVLLQRVIYPACVDCGKPTGSPRLDQCDPCHAKSTVAAFDAHVAALKARHRLLDDI